MNQRHIIITNIESHEFNGSQVITLVADNERFQFWQKKKDGSETKAYTQFQGLELRAGMSVEISFESKPDSYVNKKGVTVETQKHTILFFKTGQSPAQSQKASTNQNKASDEVMETIEKIRNAFKGMDIALKSAEKKISELENANIDILGEIHKINEQLTFIQEGNNLIKPDVKNDPRYQRVFGDEIPIIE